MKATKPENVKKAIAIMQRAKERDSVSMELFQTDLDFIHRGKLSQHIAKTEAELHTCGNKACFAGHIAISPEFHADGGYCSETGMPMFDKQKSDYNEDRLNVTEVISHWLGIDNPTAYNFIYVNNDTDWSSFYENIWQEVTADDVIRKLKELL